MQTRASLDRLVREPGLFSRYGTKGSISTRWEQPGTMSPIFCATVTAVPIFLPRTQSGTAQNSGFGTTVLYSAGICFRELLSFTVPCETDALVLVLFYQLAALNGICVHH